ncbi:MAG: hypothetical protein PHV33_00405 [Elusimicrobiales bacterium]|nr:hypothetical protein [Elusimicrobiales bacterium]
MKSLKLTLLLLAAFTSASRYTCAQWIGSDGHPLEPAKAQVSYLGSDVTKSTTPEGGAAVVSVYGEGYPTPPVYPVKSEQISALQLDVAQEAALKKELPEFSPWTLTDYGTSVKYFPFSKKQLPYAISWDYNGKNPPIKVITGHDETQNYLAIFRPEEKGYKVIRREAGFVHTTGVPHNTLPMLRMLKRGTTIRILDEHNPRVYVLKHDAFTYFEIWISSGIPSDSAPQLNGDNDIYYFHEGLFPVASPDVVGFRVKAEKPAESKAGGDIQLSPEIAAALSKFNKDFKLWSNRDYPSTSASVSPQYALKHDFNGDGIEDMVVAGHDNDANLVIEVMSGPDGYHVNQVGENTPCYAKARERNAKLKFKPSHSLSLYRKGTDYISLTPKATKNLWNHSDRSIVAIRMMNTCTKWLAPGAAEDFGSAIQYGDWAAWTEKDKDKLYVYGEADDTIYCPGGIDSCGFELHHE